MAFAIGGSVYQIPIQVDDALEVIESVAARPSVTDAFADGVHASRTSLRPLKQVRTKVLLDVGGALGGRYHVAFRGYHALITALLIGVFVFLARVRSWRDLAALAFALTVLTGMHTFSGLLREAYPVNHFLLVALYGLTTFALARTRGGWWIDGAAVLLLVTASLTLESGVLLWPIAIAGYAGGLRGISRRGLYGMTAALIGYGLFRILYLQIQSLELGARGTGFGAGVLTGAEQIERFGDAPILLYAYNVVMAAVSVLLSQPIAGHWAVLDAWQAQQITPVYVVEIGSSFATTCLIAWYVLQRRAGAADPAETDRHAPAVAGAHNDSANRRRATASSREGRPIALVFVTLLVLNATLCYAYAKAEIISLAGVFYALVAFAAMRELLARQWRGGVAVALGVALMLVAGAWGIRAAGLHFKLRHAAFEARGEWAAVLPPRSRATWPRDPHVRALVSRLKEEAILNQRIAPTILPRRYQAWWGQD
jgi:hypothetical protein